MEIDVQEDATSGRANVINATTDQYVPEVHVKAIGSADSEFRAGETDLRGILVADNLRGTATVIARQDDDRYAFYRGQTWLGAAADAIEADESQAASPPQGKFDYQQNLRGLNNTIQTFNCGQYDDFRRAPNKGVEVQQAR